jgi:caa(3)-type oxidase subunit IV
MKEKQSLLRTPVIPVFIVLMIATVVSWWVGEGSALEHTALIVISIAFVKCFLIGLYFMEIIHAPDFLRLALVAWCGAGLVGVNGIYLFL